LVVSRSRPAWQNRRAIKCSQLLAITHRCWVAIVAVAAIGFADPGENVEGRKSGTLVIGIGAGFQQALLQSKCPFSTTRNKGLMPWCGPFPEVFFACMPALTSLRLVIGIAPLAAEPKVNSVICFEKSIRQEWGAFRKCAQRKGAVRQPIPL